MVRIHTWSSLQGERFPISSILGTPTPRSSHLATGGAAKPMTFEEEQYEEIYVEKLAPSELLEYARYGEEAIITELVGQGLQDRLHATDDRGNTMLHMFAANGHVECIQAFLKCCPQLSNILNYQNNEGNTPLHWACVAGQLTVVRLLLDAGATVAVENKAERTPICEAHKHRRTELLKFFEETLTQKEQSEEIVPGNLDESMNMDVRDECMQEDLDEFIVEDSNMQADAEQ